MMAATSMPPPPQTRTIRSNSDNNKKAPALPSLGRTVALLFVYQRLVRAILLAPLLAITIPLALRFAYHCLHIITLNHAGVCLGMLLFLVAGLYRTLQELTRQCQKPQVFAQAWHYNARRYIGVMVICSVMAARRCGRWLEGPTVEPVSIQHVTNAVAWASFGGLLGVAVALRWVGPASVGEYCLSNKLLT